MKIFINTGLIVAVLFVNDIFSQNIYIGNDIAVKGSGKLFVSGNFTTNSTAIYTNDATVEIKGNIINDKASMTQGAGLTQLTGAATQTISGAQPFVVNNITINNTSVGSTNIIVNKNLIIGNNATFTDGILESATDSITFKSAATYSGASDISHVNGLVEKIGNQTFVFPVGDGIKLRTASIAAPIVATDVLTCRYRYLPPTAGALDGTLNHISITEHWIMQRTNGSSDPLVTLSYDSAYSGGVTNVADLRVVNLLNGVWKDKGGPGVGTPIGSVKATVVTTTWGEFTLGSSTVFNPLPIELVAFKADYNTNNKGVDLKWETATEKNSDYFTVERSIDGNEWFELLKQKASGNSTSTINYADFDAAPKDGINYYRLKETDFNGDYIYSGIEYVTINSNASAFAIFPNPATTSTILNYWVASDREYQYVITNALGQIFMKENVFLKSGGNQIALNMEQFVPGNYFLKIHSTDFSEVQTINIIKIN